MAKKGSSQGSGLAIAAVVIIGLIASVPKEAWLVVGLVVVGYFLLRMFGRRKSSAKVVDLPKVSIEVVPDAPSRYRIPSPPSDETSNAKWIPPGEAVTIQYGKLNFILPGGMLYVGKGMRSESGRIDPALVNPKLPVAEDPVDESLRLMNYWPSYSDISPEARRAYLQWLAGGRSNPKANIGYVFLFFYGLERRALVDAKQFTAVRVELPFIVAEVSRLLAIYGESSGSFHGYAGNFLEHLRMCLDGTTPVYNSDPPLAQCSYEIPLRMRLGLGQMAANKVPVPAKWAHAWALSEPNISKRTPIRRCEEAFELLFARKYAERYGEGMVLPVNRTRLKSGYRPASAGLLGQEFALDFGGLPDVAATTLPVGRLQQLVDECVNELDGYSRFIGRNPDKKDSLEALIQLPPALWPAAARAELDAIKLRIGDGLVVMTFGELSGRLKSAGAMTRDKVLSFARALESVHLGMEPDVLAGAKIPKGEDRIVLFATQPEDGDVRSSPAYKAAAVTIGLSYAVAAADGDVSAAELTHLSRQADSWTHLSGAHRKRLKAYLRLQMDRPTALATFEKQLEPLGQDARRAISQFLANLAQVDGVVDPAEVKLLEKLYRTLGVDSQLLYGDLHIASTQGAASVPRTVTVAPRDKNVGDALKLDPARIAALQQETEKVSALLAGVFADEERGAESANTPEEDEPNNANLVGLDPGHSAFLRILLSRPLWSKQDLVDMAEDMELMLEGALERVNEAFFDHFDEPLTSGDDPLEVNQSLLQKMPA